MRDIKFRAWDKQDKTMCDPLCLEEIIVGRFNTYLDYDHKDMVWMQFTGLKDKNGKEIYEGDIVEADGLQSILVHDFSDARKYVSPLISDQRRLEKRRSNYIVYWHDTFIQFSFKPAIDQTFIDPDVNKRNMEVIGNIYENPDLLK